MKIEDLLLTDEEREILWHEDGNPIDPDRMAHVMSVGQNAKTAWAIVNWLSNQHLLRDLQYSHNNLQSEAVRHVTWHLKRELYNAGVERPTGAAGGSDSPDHRPERPQQT